MQVCTLCRGAKLLCSKKFCPILLKLKIRENLVPKIKKEIKGNSPPSIFVGSYNYPKVFAGPLVPPFSDETEFFDLPEKWSNINLMEFIKIRMSLFHGRKIEDVSKPPDYLIDFALADKYFETEIYFEKTPNYSRFFDPVCQPFGPSGIANKIIIGNAKWNKYLEKYYFDNRLKAKDAVLLAYKNKVEVSKIQKALSAGAFGVERKIVPTRWAITTVDSTVSSELIKQLKIFDTLDSYELYFYKNVGFDDIWLVILIPGEWKYELIEAWYPGTIWNPSKKIEIISSHEFYKGRKTYAEIGGCYYAARLAVSEFLFSRKRQAGVVILRESHPGYALPAGVWLVRESVREALKRNPEKVENLKDVFKKIDEKMCIKHREWIMKSEILKNMIHQKKLVEYL
ncbi:MAG: Nre family DNA repair protein [archaeon]